MVRCLALLLLLLFSPTAHAQSELETLFEQANQAMEAQDYEKALEGYRKCLAKEPTTGALWNAGMAAYFLNRGEEAKGFWSQLKEADPADFAVRAKLVQVHQMLGDFNARDAEIGELVALWKAAPPDSELGQKTEFCRDQFMAAGHRVFAMEQYAFEDPRAVRFVFISEDPAMKGAWLSLGSYKATNDFMHESGELEPDKRAFHLDGYKKDDQDFQHCTYAFFGGEPSYEPLRAMIVDILEGRTKPISGTSIKDGKTTISVPSP